jgi:transcriptional regulator with XRE-family HTH domain
MPSFGDELRKRIEKKYKYSKDFAEAIDVRHASVSQWLGGVTYPSADNLIKVCEVLNWDFEKASELIFAEKKIKLEERRQKQLKQMKNSMRISRTDVDGLETFLDKLEYLPPRMQKELLLSFNKMVETILTASSTF